MFIDTHTHLSDAKFSPDKEEVITRAIKDDVQIMICPASNLNDARAILELTRKYPTIFGLAGVYPGEAGVNWRQDLSEIEKIIEENPKMVGVGEIGLDSYWNERNQELELEVFKAQLEMAARLKKPAVIHNRLSHALVKEVFSELAELPTGQFHCFSGDVDFLHYVLDRGFCVGFDGNLTYKSSADLRELVKLVPHDRLVLETDSPYLPPQGKRGERNEPINVKITAQVIADLRGISLQELGEQTTENAKRLFNL